MRRRALPALIALLAGAVAALRRSRRRGHGGADGPATGAGADLAALPAPRPALAAGEDRRQLEMVGNAVSTGSSGMMTNAQVEPESRPDAGRFLSIPWSPHPDPPPTGSRELRIRCTVSSPGMEVTRVDVRETASQVFVTVLARWAPGAGEAGAAAAGLEREATATLREPLGDRMLVHAPHDAPPR